MADKKEVKRLGGGYVWFKMDVLNQNGQKVQRGKWKILVKSREAEAAPQ